MTSKPSVTKNNTFTGPVPPAAEIRAILEPARTVLVVSHIDPDGDALGSQLAMAAYLRAEGKQVMLVRQQEIPDKYRFLAGITEIPLVDQMPPTNAIDLVVVLECPSFDRIGRAARLIDPQTTMINIDHHRDNSLDGVLNWFNIEASSVGEMIFEYFESIGFDVDSVVAEYLYTAILTDTGRFRFRSTSARTMAIAGELIAAGVDPQKVCDLVYFNVRPAAMTLLGKVLNTIEYHCENRVCLLTLTQKMLDDSGADSSDSDGLVDYTLYNAGARAGALFKEHGAGRTKVSLRSNNGINVAEIAGRFGGGGHFNAAGCIVEQPLAEAKETVKQILIERMRHAPD